MNEMQQMMAEIRWSSVDGKVDESLAVQMLVRAYRIGSQHGRQLASYVAGMPGFRDDGRGKNFGLALADDDSEAQAEAAEQRARFLGPVGSPDIDARSRD